MGNDCLMVTDLLFEVMKKFGNKRKGDVCTTFFSTQMPHLDTFVECCFHLVQSGVVLGINHLILQWSCNRGFPFNLQYTQYHLLWGRPAIGGSFCLPLDLFHSILLFSIYFSLSITLCFKNWIFPLCLSKELHVNKCKHVNTAKKDFFFLLNLYETQAWKQN